MQHTFQFKANFLFVTRHYQRQCSVFSGPDHGPRVDVEQGAALPWPPAAVADAQGKTRVHVMQHASQNPSCAIVSSREKGQTA